MLIPMTFDSLDAIENQKPLPNPFKTVQRALIESTDSQYHG